MFNGACMPSRFRWRGMVPDRIEDWNIPLGGREGAP